MTFRYFAAKNYDIPFKEVPRYVMFSHKEYGICTKGGLEPHNAHSESQNKFVTIDPETIVHTLTRANEFRWENGAF